MGINFKVIYSLCIPFVMCAILLMICTGCERDTNIQDTKPSLTGSIEPDVVEANTEFGFNLFNEILNAEQDKNIFISPFSVSLALAMTLNGAAETTEQAMTDTLQLQGNDSETINTNYALLLQALKTSDPKVTLEIANSLWADQHFTFNQDFLQRNTDYFGAEVSTLDFADPNSVDTINQWVDTNTNGKIEKILEQIDENEILFLINAIYFKGAWQTEFDPADTRDNTFHLTDGSQKQVPMMARDGEYPFYYASDFTAISLPYGNGRVSMYIFLPSQNASLDQFLENLNAENWQNWISQFHEQKVWLQIPKYKFEYKVNLNKVLSALGMGIAFDTQAANFRRMLPDGVIPTSNLSISRVDHKTYVEVNEEGTEAAAVTNVGIVATSAPPEFIVNRPFFFAIHDNETKTVLFMGTVVDPTEE